MASPTLTIALELAGAGLPVFPCNGSKMPAIPKQEGGRGFQDATTATDAIRNMFARRNAALVGVPTGPAAGFDVLDIDPQHGGDIWERDNLHRLPETRVHETPSGGRHHLFRHAPGVRNSASSKRLAPGVDVRGEGGYVIFPPSLGYRVISDADIAHWPDWLLSLVLPPPARTPSAPIVVPAAVRSEVWRPLVDGCLNRVRRAAPGSKHFTLRNEALLLGGMADQAGFSDSEAAQWLESALPFDVRDWANARKTIAWGLEQGRLRPMAPDDGDPRGPPDLRRKETLRTAFRMLRAGVAGRDIIAALDAQNAGRPDPLPTSVIRETVLWAASRIGDTPDAR